MQPGIQHTIRLQEPQREMDRVGLCELRSCKHQSTFNEHGTKWSTPHGVCRATES